MTSMLVRNGDEPCVLVFARVRAKKNRGGGKNTKKKGWTKFSQGVNKKTSSPTATRSHGGWVGWSVERMRRPVTRSYASRQVAAWCLPPIEHESWSCCIFRSLSLSSIDLVNILLCFFCVCNFWLVFCNWRSPVFFVDLVTFLIVPFPSTSSILALNTHRVAFMIDFK